MSDYSIQTQTNEHDQHFHLPPKSIWPIILAFGSGLIPIGIIALSLGYKIVAELLMISGGVVFVVSLMGWAQAVIKDKEGLEQDEMLRQTDLMTFLKYFLISEAAIFAALFTHYFYHRYTLQYWPPVDSPHLSTHEPALATLILMFSSFTMHMAHGAIEKGKKISCKNWMLFTAALGLIFLGFQGFEWGLLINQFGFTQNTNIFGTMFYMMTGFHGFHVSMGILMIILVYGRLEMGHMNEKRHFSVIAASWYWHFVDIIWILLFFSIYLI